MNHKALTALYRAQLYACHGALQMTCVTLFVAYAMQAGIPTFQMVDLPGIQTYPEEQEKATQNLFPAT